MNVFKILYGSIKQEDQSSLDVNNSSVNWNRLSDEFTTKFNVFDKTPVGKVNSCGFEFKLNYPNFYPAVPKVSVTKSGNNLTILQKYDFKAKATQYYWISGWVFGIIFISIISLLGFLDSRVEPTKGMLPITLFFIFAMCFVLLMFVRVRTRLWKEAQEKTVEYLSIIGVSEGLPEELDYSDNYRN